MFCWNLVLYFYQRHQSVCFLFENNIFDLFHLEDRQEHRDPDFVFQIVLLSQDEHWDSLQHSKPEIIIILSYYLRWFIYYLQSKVSWNKSVVSVTPSNFPWLCGPLQKQFSITIKSKIRNDNLQPAGHLSQSPEYQDQKTLWGPNNIKRNIKSSVFCSRLDWYQVCG